MARKLLLTLFLLLTLSSSGFAALSIDAVGGNSTGFSSCSSDTISATLAGTADFLLVGGSGVNGTLALSQYLTVTWNTSESLTKRVNQSSGNQEWPSIWTRAAPTTGTHDIVVAPTGTSDTCVTGYMSFIGADSSNPEATNSASGSGTAVSVSITTLTDGAYAVDAAAHHQYNSDLDKDASQTIYFEGGGWFQFNGSYELKATAGAVSMDHTSGASNSWATVVASIKPAGGAAATRRSWITDD